MTPPSPGAGKITSPSLTALSIAKKRLGATRPGGVVENGRLPAREEAVKRPLSMDVCL